MSTLCRRHGDDSSLHKLRNVDPGAERGEFCRPRLRLHCGRICFKSQKVNLSHVFAGQTVGVTQVGERIWLVTFMQYDLGYFDDERCRLEPIENPFGPKVLPMSSE